MRVFLCVCYLNHYDLFITTGVTVSYSSDRYKGFEEDENVTLSLVLEGDSDIPVCVISSAFTLVDTSPLTPATGEHALLQNVHLTRSNIAITMATQSVLCNICVIFNLMSTILFEILLE